MCVCAGSVVHWSVWPEGDASRCVVHCPQPAPVFLLLPCDNHIWKRWQLKQQCFCRRLCWHCSLFQAALKNTEGRENSRCRSKMAFFFYFLEHLVSKVVPYSLFPTTPICSIVTNTGKAIAFSCKEFTQNSAKNKKPPVSGSSAVNKQGQRKIGNLNNHSL